MYKFNDPIYIIDEGMWVNKGKIHILKRSFENYTDRSRNYLVFDGETSLTIQSWAVSSNLSDAVQFAIAYLISIHELNLTINNGFNFKSKYNEINQTHPDLIVKYIDKIVEPI